MVDRDGHMDVLTEWVGFCFRNHKVLVLDAN